MLMRFKFLSAIVASIILYLTVSITQDVKYITYPEYGLSTQQFLSIKNFNYYILFGACEDEESIDCSRNPNLAFEQNIKGKWESLEKEVIADVKTYSITSLIYSMVIIIFLIFSIKIYFRLFPNHAKNMKSEFPKILTFVVLVACILNTLELVKDVQFLLSPNAVHSDYVFQKVSDFNIFKQEYIKSMEKTGFVGKITPTELEQKWQEYQTLMKSLKMYLTHMHFYFSYILNYSIFIVFFIYRNKFIR
ncbi:hypothetical protein K2P97_12095 [bacterium]|nr:hypothetical protein [bacterium]